MPALEPQWRSKSLGPEHAIPALEASLPHAEGPSVLLLHGLGASKESHRKELDSLARAGLRAVAIDAPHHGARRGAWLEEMDRAKGAEAHLLFLRMLPQLVSDVRTVVGELHAGGHGPVAVLGISMGAFAALAAASWDTGMDCTVSILGSPDWSPREGAATPEMEPFMAQAPVHRLSCFAPRALLIANAGLDKAVRPEASRRFFQALRPRYAACPDRLVYLEYPDSEHHMRPNDWEELWQFSLGFLTSHLRQT